MIKSNITCFLWILIRFSATTLAATPPMGHDWSIFTGTGIAYIHGNSITESNFKPRQSYSLGMQYPLSISPRFSNQIAVSFERKGNQASIAYYDQTGMYEGTNHFINHYDYLQLSIAGRLYLDHENRYFVQFGTYLGYLLQQQVVVENQTKSSYSYSNTNQYLSTDAGLVIGIGFRTMLNHHYFVSGNILGNYGLKQIHIPYKNAKTNTDEYTINHLLQLGIGYLIPEKQKV